MYKVVNTEGYDKIMKKYHFSSLAAKVMVSKGIDVTNKIKVSDPYKYNNMDKVVSMILKSINDKKKIAIYGDYDVDGICSVSILYRTFKLLGYDVGYYVPNRYEDGYGLSSKIVKQMKDKKYDLIICVDNGIKANETIEEARSYKMDVIVLDHHQKEEILPNYNLFLHPEYSSFSDYNMCGASICYYLSLALLGYEDEKILILSGIATIGDVMPLIDQNKIIVAKAIDTLNKINYKAIDLLNNDNKKYDELLISMQIVPKLNSIGRICKNNTVNKLVQYLTSDDNEEINKLAKFIEQTNIKRRAICEEYFNKLDRGDYCNKVIIEKDDNMLEGINGIIAAKFVNKYHLPSIIFSLDDTKEYYKGSARSINGLNIIELFKDNAYIEFYGGHKSAAGLSVKCSNYQNFVNTIEENTKNNEYEEELLEVIEINEDELSYKAYLDLLKFAPFGEGNTPPLFLIKGIDRKRINKSRDNKHILINFNKESNLVGFNLSSELKNDIISYDVIFKIEANNLYSNRISCKCVNMEESKVCMSK